MDEAGKARAATKCKNNAGHGLSPIVQLLQLFVVPLRRASSSAQHDNVMFASYSTAASQNTHGAREAAAHLTHVPISPMNQAPIASPRPPQPLAPPAPLDTRIHHSDINILTRQGSHHTHSDREVRHGSVGECFQGFSLTRTLTRR